MLFSRTGCLLVLTTSVAAAPYEKRFEGARRHWDLFGNNEDGQNGDDAVERVVAGTVGGLVSTVNEIATNTLSAISKGIENCKAKGDLPQSSEPLPPVSEGLVLYHVAIGRGTQNYTCDLNNATAVPTAAGAVADLYDADCAAGYSRLCAETTTLYLDAFNYPTTPSSSSSSPLSPESLIGHHYFTDSTTAYFNLDTASSSWGQGGFAKIASVPAPANSTMGKLGGTDYNGAVPWLKLSTKAASQCRAQEVYRVHTAGGQPPKTCDAYRQRNVASFQIQYSAEYWFYATPE